MPLPSSVLTTAPTASPYPPPALTMHLVPSQVDVFLYAGEGMDETTGLAASGDHLVTPQVTDSGPRHTAPRESEWSLLGCGLM